MIGSEAGIALAPIKRNLVYTRLARRLRAHGMRSFHEYLSFAERSAQERQLFVNALTTNHTSFFREADHFAYLAELVHARSSAPHVWCAASSSGEEPYSIVMTMSDALPRGTRFRILASDVDTDVLAAARRAVYREEDVARLDLPLLQRAFLRGVGKNGGNVRVRRELREAVRFEQINLLDDHWPIEPPYDLVFCRNVLFYFARETQRRILERFARILVPDGLLFTGHAESLHHCADLYRPVSRCVYRRL